MQLIQIYKDIYKLRLIRTYTRKVGEQHKQERPYTTTPPPPSGKVQNRETKADVSWECRTRAEGGWNQVESKIL